MSTEPISRARMTTRLITNLIIAPAALVAVAIICIWLLGVVGIINVKG